MNPDEHQSYQDQSVSMSEILFEVVHLVRQKDDSDENDSCNRDNYPVTCTPGSPPTGSVSAGLISQMFL